MSPATRKRTKHALGRERQLPNANSSRRRNGIRDRRSHGDDPRFADTLRSERSRLFRFFNDDWLDRDRHVQSAGNLIVHHRRVCQPAFGSFKTFMLLEMAGSLMAGIPFLGKKVRRRCGALIFAAEGADTLRQRKRALIEHRLKAGLQHDVNLGALPFAFVDGCRPLLDPRTVDWMVAQARMAQAHFRSQHGLDLGFIGIDTIAAAAGWDNENDAAQAQIVMNHLADVSAATGTFVLAVDHFGQDITRGSRGSTAKESAAGTIFYIYGKSDNIGGFTDTKLVLRKQRGGPQGMVFPFNAREVQIGTDRYGEPQTSRVIDWNVERSEQKPKEEKPPSAQAILEGVLAEALDRHGTEIKANGTNAVRAVRKDTVRFAFKTAYLAKHAGADASAMRQAWQRALKQAKATVAEGIEDGVSYLWDPRRCPKEGLLRHPEQTLTWSKTWA